ncbi:hypothetical protein FP515_17375 [Geobacillus thermoleovorans]|nr:hypothetical protein FP515_17375 [Geobacillus thermoleovorans]
MNLLVDSWWYIYSNQGIGFMSPFLFGCQFMSVNLLIYSCKLSSRVRQSLGKQNASRPLMQKGRETFGHTLGVYLGARMDA